MAASSSSSKSSSKSNKTEAEGKTTTSRNNGEEYCLVVGDFLEQLECPICNEIYRIPVFICENGHSICEKCKHQMSRCGYCEGSYLSARNFCLENILNNCSCPCQFQERGCPEIIKLANYTDHVNSCACNPDTTCKTTAQSRKTPPVSGTTPFPPQNGDHLFEQLTTNYEQYSRAFQSLLVTQRQTRLNAVREAGNMTLSVGSQGEQSNNTSIRPNTLDDDRASTSGTTSSTSRRSCTPALQALVRAAQNGQNLNNVTRHILRNSENMNAVPERIVTTSVSFSTSHNTTAHMTFRPIVSYPSSPISYSINHNRPFSSTTVTVPLTDPSPTLTYSSSSNQSNTTTIPSSVGSTPTRYQQLNTPGSTFRFASSKRDSVRVPTLSNIQSRHTTTIPSYNWSSLPSTTTDELSRPSFFGVSEVAPFSTIPQPTFPSRNQSTASSSLNTASTAINSSHSASILCRPRLRMPLFNPQFGMYGSHANNQVSGNGTAATSTSMNNNIFLSSSTTTTLEPETNLHASASSSVPYSVSSITSPEAQRRRKLTTGGVPSTTSSFIFKAESASAAPTSSIFSWTGLSSTIKPLGRTTTATLPNTMYEFNKMTSEMMGTLDERRCRMDLMSTGVPLVVDLTQESSDESPTSMRTTSQNAVTEDESLFELYQCSHCTFENLTSNETCTICSTPLMKK